MSSDKPAGDDLRSPLIPPDKSQIAGASTERLCIDDILSKYCGEFGLWQLKHFVLTCLAWALEAFHTMVMVFADSEPGWMCEPGSDCVWAAGGKSVCGLPAGSWRWKGGGGSSTVAEWGLMCDQKYKVGLVQSLYFAGCMIGAGIFGHLSDSKLGRKGSLKVVCILSFILGLSTSFSPNYWTYTLLRFLTGISSGGVGLCAFVLATEPVGPNKRGIAGMSTFYFFSGGIAILSGIAYVFQSWRSLYIASSIPSFLFLVFILPFVAESPRWYLVRGRPDQTMGILREIARTNGKDLPENVCVALDGIETAEETFTRSTVVDVFRSPVTRVRLFLVVAINFTCSVVYYGLSLNVVNLETNLYLNVDLNAAAYLLTAVLMDRFGRKPLGFGTQWFSGAFCVVGGLVGSRRGVWKTARMVCGVMGIFGATGTYNLMIIYAAELFPTAVRSAALGCGKQAVQLGAILVPFVVVSGGGFPFMVFGACGIVGGVLTFYLPETLNRPLYDTMNGMVHGENKLSMLA